MPSMGIVFVIEALSGLRTYVWLRSLSAVSRRIGELEDRLGARLFNRTTRRVSLTDSGRAFHGRVAALVTELEEAEHEVSHAHGALRGALRAACPGAALRTTVIVGFPGETEKDVIALEELISEIRFDHLGVFLYSDAADLPSHRLADHVPEPLAHERFHRLMARQAQISLAHNLQKIGNRYTVLIEEAIEPQLFGGRTAFQAPEVDGATYVHATELTPGSFVRVTITDAEEYDLTGAVE